MKTNDPDMVRVMTFLPQEGTPLSEFRENSNLSELKIISILRLMFPKCLIPASLDLEGIDGMVHFLDYDVKDFRILFKLSGKFLLSTQFAFCLIS